MPVRPRLVWKRPPRHDVLQFSGTEVTALGLLRDDFSVGCMPLVTEEINVLVLLRAFFRLGFSRWAYYDSFAAISKCKVVLVWHDTNIHAYALRRKLRVPVMCIQNGIRHNLGPASGLGFFSALRTLKPRITPRVDDYWVFGEASRQALEPFVTASYRVHGSYRANEYAALRKVPPARGGSKRIGFIASFPNAAEVPGGHILDNPEPFLRRDQQVISYHQWFQIDARVCRAMVRVARESALDCAIISKRTGDDTSEHRYFSHLKETSSVPVIGHEKGDGYAVADSFDYLVATDSTLGYEMLGLGARVAFVSGRLRSIGIDSSEMSFGWPLNLPEHGPFWTTTTSEEEIAEFLRAFLDISEETWRTTSADVVPRLMMVDPGNTALRNRIAEYVGRSV